MKAWVIQVWLRLRASYYFIPGLMCFAAVALALMTTAIDRVFYSQIAKLPDWLMATSIDGARDILTTIAGSMISVAAVTFSLTMVAVTTAAGQYGPRLIGNFMRDRGNQVTLGMFLSTFLYSLVVLRSVSGQMNAMSDDMIAAPSVCVLFALMLTLISVGVLIYYVHHIPETLNVGNITGHVASQIEGQIERGIFPFHEDLEMARSQDLSHPFGSNASQTLFSPKAGFVEAISIKGLVKWCEERGLRLRLNVVPGDFISRRAAIGDALLDDEDDHLSDEDVENILDFIAFGTERTEHQNLLFLADELVEIAARALSPGVNDPFTAQNCIYWFGNSVAIMMDAPNMPDIVRSETGTPRLWARSVTIADLCETLFGKSQQYVCVDENASREMLTVLYKLQARASASDKTIITHHIEQLRRAIEQSSVSEDQKYRLRRVTLT